jgi:hypothetical protein
MALIEINAEVKALTHELSRIANALEHFVAAQTGVRVGDLAKIEKADVADYGVSYAGDESTLKQEVVDLHEGRIPDRVIDQEETVEAGSFKSKILAHWHGKK